MPEANVDPSRPLTDEQLEQFLTEGYTVLRGAFSRPDSMAWVADESRLAGFDLDEPSTWSQPYVRLKTQRAELLETYAPAAFHASNFLMGGPDRVRLGTRINLFALNLWQGADAPFSPPSPESPGWHKDGWHFRHFLDSPDQGLLGIPLLTDVLPSGGATFIADGSVAPVAKFLADHPEGVLPNEFPWKDLLSGPEIKFLEATGEAGDFYLLHPYVLHAVSQNVLRRPRAISNLLYELHEPMNFNRSDADYSPVEAAILRGLGVESYDFQPTAPRFKNPTYGPIQ
jgi:hypothetical protein